MKSLLFNVLIITLGSFVIIGIPIMLFNHNSAPLPAPAGFLCQDNLIPPAISKNALRAGAVLDSVNCEWVFRPIK